MQAYMYDLGKRARSASRVLATSDSISKNNALKIIADQLLDARAILLEQNALDREAAQKNGIGSALLDRLELTPARIESMADGLRQIVQLPDPVGEISGMRYQPSGLQIGKMRVPLGVIGIIYESRPNVTADAAALCIKSGNAVILRGGSEAILSNRAIAGVIQSGLTAAGITQDAVQLVDTTDRTAVGHMLTMKDYIDVIIPRGGKSLVKRISEDARVPVIKHLEGVCHVYIDSEADSSMAIAIAVNSKTFRYGICGAMETLLIAEPIHRNLLPAIRTELDKHSVELRGCAKTCAVLDNATPASTEDWYAEYLAPILSIKVVDDMSAAIEHIAQFGSSHTDAIVTENLSKAREFTRTVDSSSVMVNAATCFADGYQYGLGAEIGISTDKLHVRGPVGLEGLTSEKYVVFGDGTTRS